MNKFRSKDGQSGAREDPGYTLDNVAKNTLYASTEIHISMISIKNHEETRTPRSCTTEIFYIMEKSCVCIRLIIASAAKCDSTSYCMNVP